MSNSSIGAIDRTLSGATTPGQSEPVNDDNEGLLLIPQSSNINVATLLDCLMLYQDTHWSRGLISLQRYSQRFVVGFHYINNKSKKLATVVEGDEKAPFLLATTPRCRGGRYSFPWIAPLYPWYIPYITEC